MAANPPPIFLNTRANPLISLTVKTVMELLSIGMQIIVTSQAILFVIVMAILFLVLIVGENLMGAI